MISLTKHQIDVAIIKTESFGLESFKVYVNHVLASEFLSKQLAINYVQRKLGQVIFKSNF